MIKNPQSKIVPCQTDVTKEEDCK